MVHMSRVNLWLRVIRELKEGEQIISRLQGQLQTAPYQKEGIRII